MPVYRWFIQITWMKVVYKINLMKKKIVFIWISEIELYQYSIKYY